MSTGNVADGPHHDGVRQTVGQSNSQSANRNLRRCALVLVGANRADSKKDYCKCADKFRQELLRQVIQPFLRKTTSYIVLEFPEPRDFTEIAGRKRVRRNAASCFLTAKINAKC